MTTKLYIDSRFIKSLRELETLVDEVGDDPANPIRKQLIAAACDGVLEQWLKEDSYNKKNQYLQIKKERMASLEGDNERWKLIKKILTGKDSNFSLNLRDMLELVSTPSENQLDKLYGGEISHLEFKIKCKEMIDEKVTLILMGKTQKLDMNKQCVQTIGFDISPKGKKIKMLELFIDGDKKPLWQTELNGHLYSVGNVNFKMVLVKGGSFSMSTLNVYGEEGQHKTTLTDYYIGETVVTQGLWKAVLGENPSKFQGDDKCPVENFSWDQCQKFLKELNRLTGKIFRLPREAEWEFAARGGLQSKDCKYAGSNEIKEVAWYSKNSGNKTHPVKQKKPNEFGIYDMSGNVFECCQIHRGRDSYGDRMNQYRYRGGSYKEWEKYCEITYIKNSDYCEDYGPEIGIRLAMDGEEK